MMSRFFGAEFGHGADRVGTSKIGSMAMIGAGKSEVRPNPTSIFGRQSGGSNFWPAMEHAPQNRHPLESDPPQTHPRRAACTHPHDVSPWLFWSSHSLPIVYQPSACFGAHGASCNFAPARPQGRLRSAWWGQCLPLPLVGDPHAGALDSCARSDSAHLARNDALLRRACDLSRYVGREL